jgi:hypothetical protein
MQFDRRNRREFITLLGGSAATWPLPGRAQAAGKVRRIGYLSPAAGPNQELRRLGWTQGQNVRIDYRYSSGRQDTVSPLVAELVGSNPDVLIAWIPPLCIAAKRATTQIPLVCLVVWDPIDIGLVSNLAHPGGNVTGVTGLGSLEIFAKRLQLLTELVPSQRSGAPSMRLLAKVSATDTFPMGQIAGAAMIEGRPHRVAPKLGPSRSVAESTTVIGAAGAFFVSCLA